MKPSDAMGVDARVVSLESALARTALAYHLQHMMPTGPTWDECGHPLCAEAKRLLPDVRIACRTVMPGV
jgi:hypothetical protein